MNTETVSTSLDPIQTIIDILEAADTEDWSFAGRAPDIIEGGGEVEFSRKTRRKEEDAVYIFGPDTGTFDKIGARYEPYIDSKTVRAEVWTPEGGDLSHKYTLDIRNICLQYANDNQERTEWTQIAPIGDDDTRSSNVVRGTSHSVHAILIDLLASRE